MHVLPDRNLINTWYDCIYPWKRHIHEIHPDNKRRPAAGLTGEVQRADDEGEQQGLEADDQAVREAVVREAVRQTADHLEDAWNYI